MKKYLFCRWMIQLCLLVAMGQFSMNFVQAQDEFDDEFGGSFDSAPETSSSEAKESASANSSSGEGQQDTTQNQDAALDDSTKEENKVFDEEEPTESDETEPGQADSDETGLVQENEEDYSLIVTDPETRLFLLSNSLEGAVGGFRVVDAGSSKPWSFRLQLVGEYFGASDFLVDGDDNTRLGSIFSFGFSLFDFLEVFADTRIYGNQNTAGNPELLQSLGDFSFGVKGYYRILPWLTAGGDVRLSFLNGVGDVGPQNDATSAGIRVNATVDLQGLETPIPLIARFNLQYWIDNSAKLVEGVENARYAALDNANEDRLLENRHLITRVERFGLGINRMDFLNLGLGFEAPLQVYKDVYVNPILEWTIGIPFNRSGFSCLLLGEEQGALQENQDDGCLAEEGVSAFPQNLTLGFKAAPIVKGLSVLFAVDIGLTGTQTFVRELKPTMPYNLMFGLSYAVDTTPPPPPEPEIREVEVVKEVPVLPPVQGRVRGLVADKASGSPVKGAVVQFVDQAVNAVVTGEDGVFTSYLFEPGEISMNVSHPEYEAGSCQAVISPERPEEGDLIEEVRCELKAKPKVGSLSVQVVTKGRRPVTQAKIKLSKAGNLLSMGKSLDETTNNRGVAEFTQLSPGTYQLKVDVEGYLLYSGEVQVSVQKQTSTKIELIKRGKGVVQVRGRKLRLKGQFRFSRDGSNLSQRSASLVAELADYLLRNPSVNIQIQAHTDNRGGETRNRSVSQNQAEAVRQALMEKNVGASRMEAKGFGSSRPLVPNITASNRARNRRVEIVIQSE